MKRQFVRLTLFKVILDLGLNRDTEFRFPETSRPIDAVHPLINIRIYLIGDSTMSIKEVGAYAERESTLDANIEGGLDFSSPRLFIEW
ncbi:MAG TPA: hypothetical protein VIX19_13515 [Terriglobales bacterium]